MCDATRQQIVDEAHSWLRTPYQINQCVKGVAVDCARLPLAVYSAVGLIEPFTPHYVQDWHLHRNEELYIKYVLGCGAVEIPRDKARAGDLGLWQWGRAYSHGGIMVNDTCVIHAYVDIGVTLDDITTHEELLRRPNRWFTFWP